MTFDKLKKNSTINLCFYSIRNILPNRKLKNRLKNKVLKSEEQKTVLKLFK
jgi:hypothetical protein